MRLKLSTLPGRAGQASVTFSAPRAGARDVRETAAGASVCIREYRVQSVPELAISFFLTGCDYS